MGEHAVLQGKQALVAAVDCRVHVTLKLRSDRIIVLHSALGSIGTSLDALVLEKPFQFVLGAISFYRLELVSGFELNIESEFSDNMGLGSSAAVVVATLRVLDKIKKNNYPSTVKSDYSLFQRAKSVIQRVQGVGSGADAAASVWGGVVCYRPDGEPTVDYYPATVGTQRATATHALGIRQETQVSEVLVQEKPYHLPPILVMYSGYKTPTPEVVHRVDHHRKQFPEVYEALFQTIEQCTKQAYQALIEEDWGKLGQLFNIQHGCLVALGVSDKMLDTMVHQLRAIPGMKGAKISGAGLGDCVIGIGCVESALLAKAVEGTEVAVQLSLEGVRDEAS